MYKTPRRILIIDDDVELVTLLVDYFTLEGFQTTPAHNGAAGLSLAETEHFDLVVLDVMMPGMNGVDVLKRLREHSQIPVLMLTARGDPVDRIVGLELGADDYVQKPCPPRELVARINAILRRASSMRTVTAPIEVGPLKVDSSLRSVSAFGREIELTSTEFSLLELLARHAGSPVSKEEIYPKVLGRQMGPYDRAIDVHVSSIRHKIVPVVGQQVQIESIRGVGYQLIVRSPDAPPEEAPRRRTRRTS
ncbi:response regulator transcription factor [Sutterella sp.]|uniref:response regulator transcription factor n=1 Tax=Sutterella sp. TaxID=1981025 RepID=UPI0026E0F99C|nr:response regulator transcription factor [Sutterella sp.]MDO5530682.1 response regulator transcription factor [Sutterella sp.]